MIYMDHAATTMLLPQAAAYMRQFEQMEYANPSSNYPFAVKAKQAIACARQQIAASIGVQAEEIYFTSGGSEADNWVIKGIVNRNRKKRSHVITSRIEHPAVLNACRFLEKQGYRVSYVSVRENGIVNLEHLKTLFTNDTALVSIMMANNEIGSIQPISEIAEIAHQYHALFHTDAVQAYGHLPISAKEMGFDLLSASAHKLNGPKGIGFLYMKKGILCDSLIHGGSQEQKRRAGTENVAGIAGFGMAASHAMSHMEEQHKKVKYLRDYMIRRLKQEIPDIKINGDMEHRLANNINCTFYGVNGESLLVLLSLDGICVSVGSACHSSSASPSHVLLAIGLTEEEAHSTLRLTLGHENTKAEADYVVSRLKEAVYTLREKMRR